MITRLCIEFGALPFEGGVLEQPFAVLALGLMMRDYRDIHAVYERDGAENAPRSVLETVYPIMRAAAAEVATNG